MSILNISTPFKNKRVIAYAKDGNTVVLKTIPLQLISGNIYKTHVKYDERNEPSCDLYIWFAERQIGILLQHLYDMEVTADKVLDFSIKNSFDSAKRYLSDIRDKIETYQFISYAQIKLMEYLAPELVQPCRDARAVYDQHRLEKEQAEKRIRAEEEAVYAAKMNIDSANILLKAIRTMKSGGAIYQEEVSIYKNRYESNTYGSVFGVLASIYSVTIPINVLGWIAKRLVYIKVENAGMTEYSYRKHNSTTFREYAGKLIQAVQADTELLAITKWLTEKDIPCPVLEQTV